MPRENGKWKPLHTHALQWHTWHTWHLHHHAASNHITRPLHNSHHQKQKTWHQKQRKQKDKETPRHTHTLDPLPHIKAAHCQLGINQQEHDTLPARHKPARARHTATAFTKSDETPRQTGAALPTMPTLSRSASLCLALSRLGLPNSASPNPPTTSYTPPNTHTPATAIHT